MKKTKLLLVITALLMAALLMSCTNETTPTDTATAEPTAAPEATDAPTIKGQIVTNSDIINKEGNYYIPLPDSWINKTSYIIDGTDTYIYHITQDANELEQNPELLHVGMSDSLNDDTGLNVFLNIGTLAYYEVIRFDFPYESPDSNDGIVYSSLLEDIPGILELTWVLDEDGNPAPIDCIVMGEFDQYDACFGAFYAGLTTKDEFMALVGESPVSTKTDTWEATGEVYETYEYSFGTVVFTDGLLTRAVITSHDIYGPRSIRNGDMLDDVMMKFTLDAEMSTDEVDIIYRANTGGDIHTVVPPSGVVYKNDDGTKNLFYTCFDSKENTSDMTMEQLEENYLYMMQYCINFCFSEDGKMAWFEVTYGPLAE